MGKINFNDLEDYLNDEADYEFVEKIKSKTKKTSIYNNRTDEKELD